MTSRGIALVTVGALVVLGAGVLTVRVVTKERERRSACAEVQRIEQLWGDHTIPGDDTRVHVLGDSYTQGAFMDDPTRSWVTTLAAETGHTVTVDGIAGTGFVAPGFCGQDTFGTRAGKVAGADVLVIQGGLNDVYHQPEQAERAAAELLSADLPPRVLVVGPPVVPGRDATAVRLVDAALSRAAADAGTDYLSTLDWDLELLEDRTHMTKAGHVEFGRRVAAHLRAR